MSKCPRCQQASSNKKDNPHRPFCSEKCKLIDFGSWANEENVISRSVKSEDFLRRLINNLYLLDDFPLTSINHRLCFFIFDFLSLLTVSDFD